MGILNYCLDTPWHQWDKLEKYPRALVLEFAELPEEVLVSLASTTSGSFFSPQTQIPTSSLCALTWKSYTGAKGSPLAQHQGVLATGCQLRLLGCGLPPPALLVPFKIATSIPNTSTCHLLLILQHIHRVSLSSWSAAWNLTDTLFRAKQQPLERKLLFPLKWCRSPAVLFLKVSLHSLAAQPLISAFWSPFLVELGRICG